MADSNSTKSALADAMKKLMVRKSFAKISISDLCEECGLNRKSFYYHFKDKYDLVNWIFDRDYSGFVYRNKGDSFFFKELCEYFSENSAYYRKVFMIQGHNCFLEHLYNHFYRLLIACKKEDSTDFEISFYSDAIVSAIKRWLNMVNLDCEHFSSELESILKKADIYKDLS